MESALETSLRLSQTEDTDSWLAEAAKSDVRAFGELYERYYPRVYRYIYHRTGNVSDAEDITAQVFVKVLEALAGFRPHAHGFAPWLFRIARNSVIDHYRRRRSQSPAEALVNHVGDEDPSGYVLGMERWSELHALVATLSADQRDVVLLRYAGDLSFPEIARAMGKNQPAVRMLLHRGLRKLKAVVPNE